MRIIIIILFLYLFNTASGQNIERYIFNDTSLFFTEQRDSLNPVSLSSTDFAEIEIFFIRAVNEFNLSENRYADSINFGKKRKERQPLQIDGRDYFFKLVSTINKEGQKIVWLSGDCKSYFKNRVGGKNEYDPAWKKRFIDGQYVFDGGSCYIYLIINLTLKTYTNLAMNGTG